FTPAAVRLGVAALQQGRAIITDTNMVKAGVSKPTLRSLHSDLFCYMAEEKIALAAKQRGTTRAVAAMEQAAMEHPDAVFAIGNAPTALLHLVQLIESGLRPALIVGVPVGFVNVVESKEQLWAACCRYEVPAIVSMGRKGGSTVAAAICNALLYTAAQTLDPAARGWQ
ncbi:MAG: precorrin-8X methylmutase, partial [Pygmaiobacter sp.]